MFPDQEKVTAAIRHSAVISPAAGVFRVAGLEINPQLASVRRGSEILELRPKTYGVLLYLVAHPNRLVGKNELIASVWEGAVVSDDVLVRCISDLRRAFLDDPKDPRILKTFPKMGYGLMANVDVVAGEPPTHAAPPAEVAPAVPAPSLAVRSPLRVASSLILLIAAALAASWWAWRRPPQPPVFEEEAEVGWWKFDEGAGATVRDSSVNRMAGTVGGTVSWNTGKPHPSLVFHGGEALVSGSSARSLPAGEQPRSITLWIKPAAPLVDTAGLFAYGARLRGPTPARFEMILTMDGALYFGAAVAGGSLRSRGTVTPGQWHMVTGVYEGPPSHRAFLTIDGAPEGEGTLNPPPATDNATSWQVGRAILGGGYRGEVRDLRVYAEPLTEAKIRALYRCSAGLSDLGASHYYEPIFGNAVVIGERAPGAPSAPLRNGGNDFAGIQFGRGDGTCGLAALRGADMGQDLRIAMDILTPSDPAGHVTEGGPYFRSRRAMAGDGLIGGASAGYWVQLKSTGMVKVKRLNPQEVVAFSMPAAGFDAAAYHHVEVEVRGETLRVWLDGRALEFEQGGANTTTVRIPSVWDGPPAVGRNRGAAGIVFSAEENRGAIGGQQVRNLQVTQLDVAR